MEQDPTTISNFLLHIIDLIKIDHWVDEFVGAIVAIFISVILFVVRWIYKNIKVRVSTHFSDAKQFDGNWYIYHWYLIKMQGAQIRLSRLLIKRCFNGTIDVFQLHPETGNKIYAGKLEFDNQNIYIYLKCGNDDDSKSITTHRIVNVKDLNLRYAFGVMSGLNHQRHPYACKIVIGNRIMPEETLQTILGRRNVLDVTASKRDQMLSLTDEQKKIALGEPDVSVFTSSLLDL